MVAALYDESLDAFAPHNWVQRFSMFRQDYSRIQQQQFGNAPDNFEYAFGGWDRPTEEVTITYRAFPPELVERLCGYGYFGARPRWFINRMCGASGRSRVGMIFTSAPGRATAP